MAEGFKSSPSPVAKLKRVVAAVLAFAQKSGVAPLVCAGLMAWPVGISNGFVWQDGWSVPGIYELLLSIALWIVFYLVFLALLWLVYRNKSKAIKNTGTVPLLPLKINSKRILARWALLLLCWLPMLIAMYPGILYNDTNFQLSQYFGNPMLGVFGMQEGTVFADHQPIFDTFVFGTIMDIGIKITGSEAGGLFVLTISQALVTSFTFAFSVNYLERVGAKRIVTRTVFLIYCLFPLISWVVTLLAKDTFFSWIYVWLIILIFEYIRSTGQVLKKLPFAIAFCLVCLLLALTKKPGLYLVILSCLLLLIVYRKSIIALLTAMLVPTIVMLLILPSLIFPTFKVSPGSPIEMLGIFYQQTARYVIDNPDDVSETEQEVIDQMIGFKTIKERYNPQLVDPLKGYGYTPGVEAWPSGQQVQDYLAVYLAQGLRHPESYFKALGALEAGWFYPWSYGDGTVFELSELSVDGHKIGSQYGLHIPRPPEIAQLTGQVLVFEKELARLPVIRLLYTPSLYILFIPLLASLLFYKGQRRYLGVMIPVWISFAFLFITPATGPNYEALRYAIPFIYTAPVIMALAITSFSGRDEPYEVG